MRITLAEEIMLLSLDDESGSVKQRQSVGWAVAGALLLELVLAERVRVSGKYLELVDSPPTGRNCSTAGSRRYGPGCAAGASAGSASG